MVWDYDYLDEKELNRIAGYIPSGILNLKDMEEVIRDNMTKKGRTSFLQKQNTQALARTLIRKSIFEEPLGLTGQTEIIKEPQEGVLKTGVGVIRTEIKIRGKRVIKYRYPAGTIIKGVRVGGRWTKR